MSGTPSLRAQLGRVLRRGGRSGEVAAALSSLPRTQEAQRSTAARVDALEARVAELDARAAGLAEAVDRLHATLVAADPELTRRIIEAVRDDVDQLIVGVNAVVASGAAATTSAPAQG